MENIFKNKTLLVLIVVFVVVAFVFYSYFFKGDTKATNATGLLSSQSANTSSALDAELFQLLGRLNKIEFDNKVFSDSRFVSLADFSQTLPVMQKGRVNPFAPIGVGGNVVTTSASKSSVSNLRNTTSAQPSASAKVAAPTVSSQEDTSDSSSSVDTGGEVIDGSMLE